MADERIRVDDVVARRHHEEQVRTDYGHEDRGNGKAQRKDRDQFDMFADESENGPLSPDSEQQRLKMGSGFGITIAGPVLKKPKLGVTRGFNPDEEINSLITPKKKKLIPLEPMRSEEQIKKEREEEAKQIVSMIPTSKEDLFGYNIDWDIVEEAEIVSKKMKPWVTKKIIEYLGEEEATLIDFVVTKMANRMPPKEILDQLAFVLEDEAEVLVIKLWRLLMFEMIRAQRLKEKGQLGNEAAAE